MGANLEPALCWQTMRSTTTLTSCNIILRPRQNGRHFADDILNAFSWMKTIFYFDSNILKFVPRGPAHDKSSLVQVTAWHRLAPSHYLKQRWLNSLPHLFSSDLNVIVIVTGNLRKHPRHYENLIGLVAHILYKNCVFFMGMNHVNSLRPSDAYMRQ